MPSPPRLVLFALDDTLVDRWPAHRQWADEFAAAHSLGEKAAVLLTFAAVPHADSMESFFPWVCEQFGLTESARALWRQYEQRITELITCPAPVVTALTRLRRAGWRIGIVTNGTAGFQVAKIRAAGLDRLADAWCVSSEASVSMPDPAIFRLAASRCGTPAAAGGWMIGNSLPTDITGGHNAGLTTIWVAGAKLAEAYRQRGGEIFTGQVPDFVTANTPEAIEILIGH